MTKQRLNALAMLAMEKSLVIDTVERNLKVSSPEARRAKLLFKYGCFPPIVMKWLRAAELDFWSSDLCCASTEFSN